MGFLCHDRVFLRRDKVWPRQGILGRNIVFLVATEFGFGCGFYVMTEYSYVATKFGLDRGF